MGAAPKDAVKLIRSVTERFGSAGTARQLFADQRQTPTTPPPPAPPDITDQLIQQMARSQRFAGQVGRTRRSTFMTPPTVLGG